MRIILIQDVPNLGQKGQEKNVKPGFARNYLISQNLAVLPNDPKAQELIKNFAFQKKEQTQEQRQSIEQFQSLAGSEIIFKVKVNKQKIPYRAITKKDIAQKLKIKNEMVEALPIKKLGKHSVKIKSGENKVAITVVVESEK